MIEALINLSNQIENQLESELCCTFSSNMAYDFSSRTQLLHNFRQFIALTFEIANATVEKAFQIQLVFPKYFRLIRSAFISLTNILHSL